MLTLCLAASGTGCSLTSYVGYRIAPDYPRSESQTVEIPGLAQPVLVYLDEAGVPHVHAQNEWDLLRATGFVQGRDRFFGMDMMRRFARGRIAELVGDQKVLSSSTVEFDIAMRGWGIDRAVDDDVRGLDPPSRKRLEVYADGINRALANHRPIEYRLLGVDPEPWTIEDSFALGRLNAWSVSHNWHQEMSRLLIALQVGVERGSAIYGHDYWRGGTSIAAAGPVRKLPPAIAPELAAMFQPRPYRPRSSPRHARGGVATDVARLSSASNGWVIGPDRSVSGKPILANDPHMAHMVPSLVYQMHLKAPGLDVIGGTIAGIPYVLFGHNEQVAWGTTSAVADAIDLYVERTPPGSAHRYEVAGKLQPFEREEHIIHVRDGSTLEPRPIVIRRSRHGPILNDMYPGLFPSFAPPVAVKWDPGSLSGSIGAVGRANRARTVESLREALLGMLTPAASWVAADRRGTIAIFTTGTLPVRNKHLGTFPAPGWLPDYDWAKSVDPARMPHALSRDGGYFAHGNNLISNPERSEVFLQIDSAPSYRFDRIVELIEETPAHHPQSMARIHRDVLLPRARRLAPIFIQDLEEAERLSPVEQRARAILRSWDFQATPTSSAAVIFFVTYREAIMAALEDELDARGFEFVMAQRYSTNVADLWFADPDHVVWDHRGTTNTERRADVLRPAFRKAVAWLAERQGALPDAWQWGLVHDIRAKHAFGSQAALADFVNMPRTPAGGGLDSVWKSHFDLGHPDTPYRAVAGPVYRMIIDLADMKHGYWIVDTGSSGWPGSPHYADQHELWRQGQYFPMRTDWSEIRETAEAVLTLRPPPPPSPSPPPSPGVGRAGTPANMEALP